MSAFGKPAAHELILRRIETAVRDLPKRSRDSALQLRIRSLIYIQLMTEIDIPSDAIPDVVKRLEAVSERFFELEGCKEHATGVALAAESILNFDTLKRQLT